MFGLIKKLIDLLGDVNVDVLLSVLDIVKDLLDVGTPPSVSDESDFRLWINQLLVVADKAANLSESDLDDKIVLLLVKATKDDEVWQMFYAMLLSLFDNDETDINVFTDAVKLQDKTGIDPATILAIIQVIKLVIELFQNRKK